MNAQTELNNKEDISGQSPSNGGLGLLVYKKDVIDCADKTLADCEKRIKHLEKLERMASCGTVDSVMQMSDEDKRLMFAMLYADATKLSKVNQLLCDVAQILNVVEQEWKADGTWSEWDQGVREQITEFLTPNV